MRHEFGRSIGFSEEDEGRAEGLNKKLVKLNLYMFSLWMHWVLKGVCFEFLDKPQ